MPAPIPSKKLVFMCCTFLINAFLVLKPTYCSMFIRRLVYWLLNIEMKGDFMGGTLRKHLYVGAAETADDALPHTEINASFMDAPVEAVT